MVTVTHPNMMSRRGGRSRYPEEWEADPMWLSLLCGYLVVRLGSWDGGVEQGLG